jgi:bifunctional non-homologous end joining protein LigD
MTTPAKSRSQSAKAVDRQLARYREMRDFHVTAEPRGNGASSTKNSALPFVVQKHAATRLHYDFRLGWNGVLKSWAVTKGPSYYTGDKRLAVEVEDHPMEYGGFEGTIPKGQYGGGTVMVWDFGEWQPLGDVNKQLADGNLKFLLKGTKLKGKWALVRMKPHPERDRSGKPNWLLLKERDEYAQHEEGPSITDVAPDSALTHRSIEEIAASKDHVWDSGSGLRQPDNNGARKSPAQKAGAQDRKIKSLDRLLTAAPREDFPGFIPPQLAEEARSLPSGNNWVHELKLDGYRTQIQVRAAAQKGGPAKARIFTRKGLDWTARMPQLAEAAAELGVESAILDGELVVLDHTGRSSFSDLQAAFQNGKKVDLFYFAFDILHLNGHNLRGLPLLKRKEILEKLLPSDDPVLRFCEHIRADGERVFQKACELGAEGIVSKQVSAPYTSGRRNTWLKRKGSLKQEFVIGGFTPVAKTGRGIGALLLGYYDEGKLIYAGRTGTGFSQQTEHMLRVRLDALVQKAPSFAELPREARENATWVKPELVADVHFASWTNDNLIRQSSFKGLREDKPAKEIVRETSFADVPPSTPPVRSPVKHATANTNLKAAKTTSKSEVPISITRPAKVLDETSGMTKQDLAEYLVAVADRMLPHIADRPISILRCPNGVGKQSFFQKHISAGLPPGVLTVPLTNRKNGASEDYLYLNSVEGLVGMAQMGVLEIHPWGSKIDNVDKPDRIIFDLDPDETIPWPTLSEAAFDIRGRLKDLGLTSYVKSTGGKGLHVVMGVEPDHDWTTIKQFAHNVVLQMEKDNPSLYLTKMSKAARRNHIYLDYLRNDRESTAVAPFSTRARPGVPVAVTLDWKEIKADSRPVFHVSDFDQWRSRLRKDPWKEMLTSPQRLTKEMLLSAGVKL